MKFRNGFVSNSSSSSFVMIGRPITLAEAEKLFETSRVVADTRMYGGEGYYIIEVKTPEMMQVLKEASEGKFNFTKSSKNYNNGQPYVVNFEVDYYEVFAGEISDDGETSFAFAPSELPPIMCSAIYMRVDQHTPKNANEMREAYLRQR
jgi:hypothetical protein